jgi:hypothetical protein
MATGGPDIDTLCASTPFKALQKHFGFEPDRVVAVAKQPGRG